MDSQEFLRQVSNADLLIAQHKYDHAESILTKLMNIEINDFEILRMMAIVKIGLRKYNEAEDICKIMISAFPDESFSFYLLANIKSVDRKFAEAHDLLDTAIRINPDVPFYHSFKANIYNHQNEHAKALDFANNALSMDAEDSHALNARATALVGLNRKDEAFETIDKALESDPNNADTHANLGWSLLHKGNVENALNHFKISLSIDPTDHYAQAGMQEAMKAKFPMYRYFLMTMLRISNFTENYKWGFIIGGYLLYRFLFNLAENNPSLQPFIIPVVVLLGLFFISSWIFSPLMNLYLLSNPFGKYTLSDHKKLSARLVGLSLGLSLLFLVIFFITKLSDSLLYGALISFVMMIPLGSMFNPHLDANRKKLVTFSIVLISVAFIDIILSFSSGTFGSALSVFTAILFIGYQFYANYVLIRE
ncbi:MAG: hypothetical protein RIR48_424 [Bacteroidota bacterium]